MKGGAGEQGAAPTRNGVGREHSGVLGITSALMGLMGLTSV